MVLFLSHRSSEFLSGVALFQDDSKPVSYVYFPVKPLRTWKFRTDTKIQLLTTELHHKVVYTHLRM